MSHVAVKSSHQKLIDRINKHPQGAPPSESLFKILELLFTKKEAELVAQLPINPFTLQKASKIWHMSKLETEKILNRLAEKAIILDIEFGGKQQYMLPPPMIGFFEFTLMRTHNHYDQKLLSELYHQYVTVEEEFIKKLLIESETKLGRVFVNEEVLSNNNLVEVLDYEKTTHIIESASSIAVSTCYCRHKMEHLNKACDAPMEICMSFNMTADALVKNKHARKIDIVECKDLLQQAYAHNLVQCGDNVQNDINFICNCCGCCCEALIAAKRFGMLHPIQTSQFLPKILINNCVDCGQCIKMCPVGAISLENDSTTINEAQCIGCGLCLKACKLNAIFLDKRKEKILTPVNSVHKAVLIAIEKGKLQNLIFDNQALTSHRAMAAILGAILNMSPAKQILANKQIKSVYLASLINKLAK